MILAFDWGHTLMDERRDRDVPLGERAIHLMPGVREAVAQLSLPLALWANTRDAGEREVRGWLASAGLDEAFRWVVTSVDAGARKPDPRFFAFALARCGCGPADVLFVGNQRNTDVAGGEAAGIRTIWLSGAAFRSDDDRPCAVEPSYTIETLTELPALIRRFVA